MTTPKMSRKETLKNLSKYAAAVERACDASHLSTLYRQLRTIIEQSEKEHRAFGRRLVGSAAVAKGRMPVSAAVDYFVVKVVCDQLASGRPLDQLSGLRLDYIIGAVITETPLFRLHLPAFVGGQRELVEMRAFAHGLDYADMVQS